MMKKTLFAIMALGMMSSATNASNYNYECWMYKSGKPMWYVKAYASNKSDAEQIAAKKFKKIGRSGDYIKCHYWFWNLVFLNDIVIFPKRWNSYGFTQGYFLGN